MVDVLTPAQRQLNMSRIRARDTKPEMILRRGLHAKGLRFRLHRKDLPGRPDIVFPSRRAVILIHGCFWHGHGCALTKVPQTNSEFWKSKIQRNIERDRQSTSKLQETGWRVLVIWECLTRGPRRLSVDEIIARSVAFLNEPEASYLELSGKPKQ